MKKHTEEQVPRLRRRRINEEGQEDRPVRRTFHRGEERGETRDGRGEIRDKRGEPREEPRDYRQGSRSRGYGAGGTRDERRETRDERGGIRDKRRETREEPRDYRQGLRGRGYGMREERGERRDKRRETRDGRKTHHSSLITHHSSPVTRHPSPVTRHASRAAQKTDEVRLNKFIANSGICSRREADGYIVAGLVTVNGQVVTEMGVRVKPTDDVRFNGERMKGEQKVYIVMNKPKDYITTVGDPYAENTVMDLIGDKCPQRVYPVGRLDKNTTGVLLFTNDGEMADQLTHPSYNKKKVYHVFLDKNLKSKDFQQLLDGVQLDDGVAQADSLSYVDGDHAQAGLEIHSGRNRVVRRMFETLGYKVKKLDRVYFAGITKKNLKRGQWRFLMESEVTMLKMGSYE